MALLKELSGPHLKTNIQLIVAENKELKSKLLTLIKEYKGLKHHVLEDNHETIQHKKRPFVEVEREEMVPAPTPEEETFDEDLLILDDDDYDLDSHMDSPLLSRTSSPDYDDNSLMMSLTRSTTVSTMMDSYDNLGTKRFTDMPKFDQADFKMVNLANNFDILKQDKYNMINDFLEEKLIDNELNYYETLQD